MDRAMDGTTDRRGPSELPDGGGTGSGHGGSGDTGSGIAGLEDAPGDGADTASAGLRTGFVRVPAGVGWVLLVCGLIGSLTSWILTQDKVTLLSNPNFSPACNISSTVSCTSVMSSWQADLFGPLNSMIGMVAFPVLATLGVLVVTGLRPARWLWWCLQVGTLAGVIFVHWLMVQSLYVIGALCLYCMVTWFVTIVAFWYVTMVQLSNDPARMADYAEDGGSGAVPFPRWHAVVPVVWVAIIAVLIITRFA